MRTAKKTLFIYDLSVNGLIRGGFDSTIYGLRAKYIDKRMLKERWRYRFESFAKALNLLNKGLFLYRNRAISDLEIEGIIQRFEYTWELSWKLMKDYLEEQGIQFELITPSFIIKKSFGSKLIQNPEIWLEALDARNKMSHTYDETLFQKVIVDIDKKYMDLFLNLHLKFTQILQNHE